MYDHDTFFSFEMARKTPKNNHSNYLQNTQTIQYIITSYQLTEQTQVKPNVYILF